MDADNRLNFACACGTIAGTIHRATPDHGDHVVCHCTDCQALPAFLGAAERILDDAGGTALYQSRCARLEFARGSERLACLHLTDKPTLRWYAMCCDTPMFNTYATGRIPYVTTILANCEAAGRNRLGPPLGHLFLEDAPGPTAGLKPLSMNRLMRGFLVRMVKDYVSGDHRRNPLFDPKTLQPIATPRRLTPEQRLALS
ncbi:DUF6151 family protein [Qipengyuania profunda]|jgi:hypothetical protein|uniref:DUF6151 family protein n=1 Tax=Qipengyuania profunda TaxID=3113984 RepID=UPI002A18BE89|nr:DUF6151 family protein [Qipengyuania sp. HL-TH1]WPL56086.1 DUF6151 family protein [Qipengyuania sp. HL-TH5]